MRWDFGALPWELLGSRPAMVTLTYPGEWELWVPDADTLRRHREALKERWRRRYGAPIGVWVVEFQRRGAPHLHIYIGLPEEIPEQEYRKLQERSMARKRREKDLGKFLARRRTRAPQGEFATWLRTAWWEVVGSELSVHHGRGIDIATAFYSAAAEESANRARVAEYFWRESGKWAQKQVPEGFGSLRFYGRWGKKQGFNPSAEVAELSEPAAMEVRRVLRRLRRQKEHEIAAVYGRRPRRSSGLPRGRDGLTVFDVDGEAIGPRLAAWAEMVAAQKAAERESAERVQPYRGWVSLRALPEVPVVVDPEGFEAEDPADGWWLGREEWEAELAFERHEREQWEAEQLVELELDRRHQAQRREEARAARRAEVRRLDRERQERRARKRAGGDGAGTGASPSGPAAPG